MIFKYNEREEQNKDNSGIKSHIHFDLLSKNVTSDYNSTDDRALDHLLIQWGQSQRKDYHLSTCLDWGVNNIFFLSHYILATVNIILRNFYTGQIYMGENNLG